MTRSAVLIVAIIATTLGAACSPSGNDVSPAATAGSGGAGSGGRGGTTGTSSGAGGSGPGDVSGNAAGAGAGGSGGTGGTGTGTTGMPGGAGGAAGAVAPASDPIQAVQDGVVAYQGGDYEAAIMNLMASLAADPDGPAAPAAHYVIARSQQELNDCTMALAGYAMFLESYPDDEFADDAQFRIGQCHYETGDYATALVELQKVLDDYAGSDAANDAQYTIGLCYLEQAMAAAAGTAQDGLLDQARSAFQAAIDDYPERSGGTTSPQAQLQIGLTYEVVGDCASELAAMQKVIADYAIDPNDPSADQGCTATAGHLGACDVNSDRQATLDDAMRHIDDLTLAMPASHTCN